jgi:hypothetical protein
MKTSRWTLSIMDVWWTFIDETKQHNEKQTGSHGVFFPHNRIFLSIDDKDNPRKLLVLFVCATSNLDKKRQFT